MNFALKQSASFLARILRAYPQRGRTWLEIVNICLELNLVNKMSEEAGEGHAWLRGDNVTSFVVGPAGAGG